MRGRFITLEGGEGAGKTTQALELQKRLARRNIKILQTREPGGCPGGEAIRTFLQGEAARGHVFSPMAEALLMSAARAEHLDQLIRPFIEEGGWVICDRFMDSTLAYQGYARGGDEAAIKALNAQVAGDLVPDLTLFLDVSVEQSMARVDDRKTDKNPFVVYDSKEAAFHESL
ncbi:MAG: dTMP kinase, partial [Parvularculales bacterium]